MPTTPNSSRSSKPSSLAIADDDDPHPPPAPIELEIFDPTDLISTPHLNQLLAWGASVLSHLGASGSIRVKLVNDAQMSIAHLKYSGIEGTTDVLTFDLNNEDQSETKALDTDLIVCVDEASRRASEHNHSTEHELLLYIIHGTLHCLGYDDHTPEDFRAMHRREDQLLTLAGIGALFDRDANAGDQR